MTGDLCDVGVGIYISLDNQFPGLFVDSAEITGLFSLGKEGRGRGGGAQRTKTDQGLRQRDAYADVSGRVPVGPLCGYPLDQIDVLALGILSCAEEKHCRAV